MKEAVGSLILSIIVLAASIVVGTNGYHMAGTVLAILSFVLTQKTSHLARYHNGGKEL